MLGAFARAGEREGPVTAQRPAIDRLFMGERVEDILAALDGAAAASGADADACSCQPLALIRTKSPTSLKIALAQMRRGPTLEFRRVHADRIPNSLARDARARFL